MNVYVLWNGKYPEDTDIWGIYTTEEAALAEIEEQCGSHRSLPFQREHFRIEQFELTGDPPEDRTRRSPSTSDE